MDSRRGPIFMFDDFGGPLLTISMEESRESFFNERSWSSQRGCFFFLPALMGAARAGVLMNNTRKAVMKTGML